MIKKIKLTYVRFDSQTKDGRDLIDKNGKPYWKASLKCEELGDEWLNDLVFGSKPVWKNGDTVTLDIIEKEYNGKKQKGFKIVEGTSKGLDTNDLIVRIKRLESKVFGNSIPEKAEDAFDRSSQEPMGDEVDVKNVPF